jgi:hypothetical protein
LKHGILNIKVLKQKQKQEGDDVRESCTSTLWTNMKKKLMYKYKIVKRNKSNCCKPYKVFLGNYESAGRVDATRGIRART